MSSSQEATRLAASEKGAEDLQSQRNLLSSANLDAMTAIEPSGVLVADTAKPVPVPTTERNRWRVSARHSCIRLASHGLAVADRIFGDRVRDGFGVLMYHRCCPNPDGVARPTLNVTPERFEEQLAGLIDRGCLFRSLPSVIGDIAEGRPVARETVVVTFDDGFAGVHEFALPVLKKLSVPASVFVCTALLGKPGPMPFDPWGRAHAGRVPESCFRSLSLRECSEMLDSGLIDLGAHTHTHDDFRGRPDDLYNDMTRCVMELRTRFNIEDPTFAFPFGTPSLGFASDEMTRAVRMVGMSCALTSESRINRTTDDPFSLGRLNVFDWDTAATIQARLHGWYSWLPKLSAKFRRDDRSGISCCSSVTQDASDTLSDTESCS